MASTSVAGALISLPGRRRRRGSRSPALCYVPALPRATRRGWSCCLSPVIP